MKTLSFVIALCAAQLATAQLLPHYDRPSQSAFSGACVQGLSENYSSFSSGSSQAVPQPQMRMEERSGITAKEMVGEGSGTMMTMSMKPYASNSFGFTSGSFYMMRAGAYIVPMFAQARHNFWMKRGDGIFGAAYGYAAGGPALGIGESLFTPSFSDFFHSLTLRFGAGAMAGLGAEIGGSAFGWSTFTEAGVMGMAFTASLGPQRTYAAPYFAFGVRRALGNW